MISANQWMKIKWVSWDLICLFTPNPHRRSWPFCTPNLPISLKHHRPDFFFSHNFTISQSMDTYPSALYCPTAELTQPREPRVCQVSNSSATRTNKTHKVLNGICQQRPREPRNYCLTSSNNHNSRPAQAWPEPENRARKCREQSGRIPESGRQWRCHWISCSTVALYQNITVLRSARSLAMVAQNTLFIFWWRDPISPFFFSFPRVSFIFFSCMQCEIHRRINFPRITWAQQKHNICERNHWQNNGQKGIKSRAIFSLFICILCSYGLSTILDSSGAWRRKHIRGVSKKSGK